jgi:hypothetical protein
LQIVLMPSSNSLNAKRRPGRHFRAVSNAIQRAVIGAIRIADAAAPRIDEMTLLTTPLENQTGELGS